jgi:heme-degrading monooxygenase HmoA
MVTDRSASLTFASSAPYGGVLEKAVLPVRPDLAAEFEVAFERAKWIISDADGFRELTLSRGVEHPEQYLLLVRWDSVESHEIGFRQSAAYEEWRELLHRFYDPFPIVEHFREIARVVAERQT